MTGQVSARVAGLERTTAAPRILTASRLRLLATVAIAASVAGLFFAIPHTTEDFVYHVPRTRFHLSDEFSLWLWAGIAAMQVAGIAFAAARNRGGFILLALTGFAWAAASLLDHTGDVFRHQPWRDAPSSTIWVVGTALANLAATGIAGIVSLRWSRDDRLGRISAPAPVPGRARAERVGHD